MKTEENTAENEEKEGKIKAPPLSSSKVTAPTGVMETLPTFGDSLPSATHAPGAIWRASRAGTP